MTWGYTPLSNEVYGQIDHNLSGQAFHMYAGLNYDFTGNTFSGLTFGHTLRIDTWWIFTGFIFDTNWGIAELSINIPWCQNFTSLPAIPPAISIPQGSGMDFTCYGQNTSWYILSIFSGVNLVSSNLIFTNASLYTRTTGSNLTTGDYVATCTVLGPGGVGPQCWTNIAFHVWGTWTIPVSTECNPNFQGEINFSSLNGSMVINPSLGTYYTNRTWISLQIGVTEPAYYDISGDFTLSHLTGNYTGISIYNYISWAISLLNINGWNNFSSIYTTWLCTPYTDAAKRVYVDTLPPTAPSIITPINAMYACSTTPLTVTRSGSLDSGSQLSHYVYEIYTNSGMATGIMMSWTITPPTITGISLNISLLPLGTYYMRIVAVDNVGLSTPSTPVSFISSSQYCSTGGTGLMMVTPIIWLRNVDLDRVYTSDPIWILGLTWPTLVTISKWMLFINNITGGNGTTGIVTSHDTIYIELISSDQYATTVTSDIRVLNMTWAFLLTTKSNTCHLNTSEELIIQNIYAELKTQYNNDLSQYSDFLNTFQSMVHDESDLSNSCSLDYLLSLIESDFGGQGIDTSNHITPNCKEYSIGYDTTQRAYYAPEMQNRYYFVNRESLIRHLDYYNPGDCHINTYTNNFRTTDISDPMRHIAPNGKIYHFIGQYGWFSATEFITPKYFDSLQSIETYIDLKNPPKDIWKHTVDTAFTPITYAAPNGREYKIYKTDRWFMSYKLMKVKYYTTLSELKHHIDVNNPSIY